MTNRILPSDSPKPSRRNFLQLGGAIVAAVAAEAMTETVHAANPSKSASSNAPMSRRVFNPATASAMPMRNLGTTGHRVGIFSLGGQSAIERPNNADVAIPIIERALDLGVNYIDTSSIYGGPERWSEHYIGQVMKRRRGHAFLASKTRERTRDASLRMLEKSLELLNTDHLDLWQLHDIGTNGDVDAAFAKGGAIEALIQAKEQGLVKHLGITGHHRAGSLIECIRRYPFETVLLGVNAADPHHHSFVDKLLPLAVEKRMGIIGMKVTGRSRILSSYVPPPEEAQKHSWEGSAIIAKGPGTIDIREALYYALTLPVSTVVLGVDNVAQLEQNVQLANTFTPLSDAQMTAIADKTRPIAKQALFFRFFKRK